MEKISLIVGSLTINQTFTYDDTSVVNGTASTRVSGIHYNIDNGYSYSYSFDKLGNITDILVKNGSETVEQYHYEYDDLNQLIREDVYTISTNFTATYSYDHQGNITYKNYFNYQPNTVTSNLINLNKMYHYHYDSTVWKDQLTSVEFIDYQDSSKSKIISINHYDDSGNPLSYDGWTLTYEGRSIVTANNGNDSVSYSYNDQGIRVEKILNDIKTRYIIDGDKVLAEISDNYEIYYTYGEDGKLISMYYDNTTGTLPGTEYFYIRNQQGDIVKLIDINGNVEASYTYDACGNILNKDEVDNNIIAKANPYRYRGYRYDNETGWYYLNSRYYNPEIGRFINADGLIGETGDILAHNMYAYCQNNPVMYYDPSREILLESLVLLGTAIVLTGLFHATADFDSIAAHSHGPHLEFPLNASIDSEKKEKSVSLSIVDAYLTKTEYDSYSIKTFSVNAGLGAKFSKDETFIGASSGVNYLEANIYKKFDFGNFSVNIGGKGTVGSNAEYGFFREERKFRFNAGASSILGGAIYFEFEW